MNSVAVLGYSRPLPVRAGKDLTRVAKRLARSGAFLAVRYEETSGRVLLSSIPEEIVIADLGREGSRQGPRHRPHGARVARRQPVYRRKRAEQCWWGWIGVSGGGWWSGRIEVPTDGDAAALLTLERKGKGARLLPRDAALVIPEGEAEAVLALLNGLFVRARGSTSPGRNR